MTDFLHTLEWLIVTVVLAIGVLAGVTMCQPYQDAIIVSTTQH